MTIKTVRICSLLDTKMHINIRKFISQIVKKITIIPMLPNIQQEDELFHKYLVRIRNYNNHSRMEIVNIYEPLNVFIQVIHFQINRLNRISWISPYISIEFSTELCPTIKTDNNGVFY